MRQPNANELIPMVQKEMLEYKKKSQAFDKKLRDFDSKELTLNTRNEEYERKEKDLEFRCRELNELKVGLEEDKNTVIQKLSMLKEELLR